VVDQNGVNAVIYDASDPLANPVTPISNPMSVGGSGTFAFAAADGTYDVRVSGAGNNKKYSDIQLETPPAATISTDSLSFTQPFTSAVSTTQTKINQRSVSIFDFMSADEIGHVQARDLGVDCTAAIRACFTNVPANTEIRFPAGTYKVSGSTELVRQVSGDLTFEQGAVIDATTFTGATIFKVLGTQGTYYTNVASISAGASSVTVHATLAATLVSGDVLRLSSQAALGGDGSLWYGGRNYYYKGELCEVRSVVGQTVYLRDPVRGTYGANVAGAMRIQPVQTKITGFTLNASNQEPTEQVGLQIYYGRNCEVSGGEINGCSDSALAPFYVLGMKVSSLNAYCAWTAGNGAGYGIAVNSSQVVSISDCRLVSGRHAVTTGWMEPCRDIMLVNSYLDNDLASGAACLNTHGNTDNMLVQNCTLNNGLALCGKNDTIDGCTIYIRTQAINYNSDFQGTHTEEGFASGCNFSITNCNIFANDNPTATYLIYLNVAGYIDQLTLSRNRIFANNTVSQYFFYMNSTGAGTGTVKDCMIEDNYCSSTRATGTAGLQLAQPITVTRLRFRLNTMNVVNGYHLMWGGANATSSYVDILDNNFTSSAANAYFFECITSGAIRIRFNRNTYLCTNATPNWGKANMTASGSVEAVGNTMTNMANGAWGIISPNILLADNTLTTVSGTNSILGKTFNSITEAGKTVSTALVANTLPTAGVFALGDRVVNPSGVTTQPKAWTCTTAGGAFTEVRANLKAYTLGQWVQWPTGTNITVWECTKAGTTGAAAVVPGAYTVGTTVQDVITTGAVFTCRATTSVAFTSEGNL
jgi:hypothetical protein